MRTLLTHVDPGSPSLSEHVTVRAYHATTGEPTAYELSGYDANNHPQGDGDLASFEHVMLLFQSGPIQNGRKNGVTNEALLAIVADRLRYFQSGKFACRENALALTKIEEAMHWLHSRTRERRERNVEGTNVA